MTLQERILVDMYHSINEKSREYIIQVLTLMSGGRIVSDQAIKDIISAIKEAWRQSRPITTSGLRSLTPDDTVRGFLHHQT